MLDVMESNAKGNDNVANVAAISAGNIEGD